MNIWFIFAKPPLNNAFIADEFVMIFGTKDAIIPKGAKMCL